MRVTLPPNSLATHTAPAPTAIASGPVTDRDRRPDGVGLWVDSRDGPVQAVGYPDRATIAHGDRGRARPDVDARGDLIGVGVYTQHPSSRLIDTHTAPAPPATSVAPPPSVIVLITVPGDGVDPADRGVAAVRDPH